MNSVDGEGDYDIHDKSNTGEGMHKKKEKNL